VTDEADKAADIIAAVDKAAGIITADRVKAAAVTIADRAKAAADITADRVRVAAATIAAPDKAADITERLKVRPEGKTQDLRKRKLRVLRRKEGQTKCLHQKGSSAARCIEAA